MRIIGFLQKPHNFKTRSTNWLGVFICPRLKSMSPCLLSEVYIEEG